MEIARISALAEMASGIAHELNQPLGAIAAFAQAGERMLNRPDPMIAQTRQVLRQINDEALSAGAGIRRIRRLFDQEDSLRSLCRIPEIVKDLKPVLEMLTHRVQGDLRIDAAAELAPVNIDRLRIQHVIFALVQNACEACAERPGSHEIRISMQSDRYAVETSISDTGPGVPAESHEEIFWPFFTTKAKGTGLGLASSRAIVEAHEGTIGFENVASGGSRFWFRLPVAAPNLEGNGDAGTDDEASGHDLCGGR